MVDSALPHVFFQSGGHREGHLAESTLKDVLAQPPVGPHVPGQLGALGACVVTHLALVGFLPSVGPPVDSQVGAVLEDLAAVLTGVITVLANDFLAGHGVKEGMELALLGNGPEGRGFHQRNLNPWREVR